ncbi:MAG TPA: hypothetical protein VJJ23_03855 [Candidatus Nanoarchaeia archaeon]|nr:hypothetical protein [Candidatus Nanoarchaeia archaeon]
MGTIDDALKNLHVDKKRIKKYVDPGNYAPTKSEVVKEIGNGFVSYIKDWKFKDSNLKYAIESLLFVTIFPYILPTTIRSLNKPLTAEEKNRTYTKTEDVLTGLAIVAGIGGIVIQVVGYYQLARHDKEEFLLIPVTTNVISGIYEIGRHQVDNAKRRLIDRNKRSLDDKL